MHETISLLANARYIAEMSRSGADPEFGYIFRIRILIFLKKLEPDPDSV